VRYLKSRGHERFTLHLRISRTIDYFFIAFGVVALVLVFVSTGWTRLIWAAAGIVALLGSLLSLAFLGRLRMGPRGIAAWHQWHWTWIPWDQLESADTQQGESLRYDQLVLHTREPKSYAFPGLETPHRVAALDGSVQWAADFINSVIAARAAKRSQQSP
jgi:hypothetical protein